MFNAYKAQQFLSPTSRWPMTRNQRKKECHHKQGGLCSCLILETNQPKPIWSSRPSTLTGLKEWRQMRNIPEWGEPCHLNLIFWFYFWLLSASKLTGSTKEEIIFKSLGKHTTQSTSFSQCRNKLYHLCTKQLTNLIVLKS